MTFCINLRRIFTQTNNQTNNQSNTQTQPQALRRNYPPRKLRCTNRVIGVDIQRFDSTSKNSDECSICCGQYKDSTLVSVLKCKHLFHPCCIIEWGYYDPSCPLCKTPISHTYD